jgi:hypothetical protein
MDTLRKAAALLSFQAQQGSSYHTPDTTSFEFQCTHTHKLFLSEFFSLTPPSPFPPFLTTIPHSWECLLSRHLHHTHLGSGYFLAQKFDLFPSRLLALCRKGLTIRSCSCVRAFGDLVCERELPLKYHWLAKLHVY